MTIGPIVKNKFNTGFLKRKKEATIISKIRTYYKTFLIRTRTHSTDVRAFIEYILRFRIQGGGSNVVALIHTINLIKMGPVTDIIENWIYQSILTVAGARPTVDSLFLTGVSRLSIN